MRATQDKNCRCCNSSSSRSRMSEEEPALVTVSRQQAESPALLGTDERPRPRATAAAASLSRGATQFIRWGGGSPSPLFAPSP